MAEKPFDSIIQNGGMTRIFRTIGCIGDSLSSGEFESMGKDGVKGYHDMFEYSWGQVLGRAAGSKVYNFSRGGMTAAEYIESFAEANNFFDPEKACSAYIIALGVNDINSDNIGDISDIDRENPENNKKTFTGYYAAIIQKYKSIQPRAKFFLMTMPKDCMFPPEKEARRKIHAERIRQLAELFDNTYVLDFDKYAPEYDKEFYETYFLGGHLSPAGYVLTADYVGSYIDYIVIHNMKDFKEVGFIGTDLHNVSLDSE